MTDDGTNIPARPASDRKYSKHKKYKTLDDDNTSALLSVASATSSEHVSTPCCSENKIPIPLLTLVIAATTY
jgi:hypothetical protein